MKKIYRLIFLLILVSGCSPTGSRNEQISLDEANIRFADHKWKSSVCVGIPLYAQGYVITQQHQGTRVDLKTTNDVYVTYHEYVRDPAGQSFRNYGRLQERDSTSASIFKFDSYVSLAGQNYVDLVGFAGNRMFRIHARKTSGAAENEGAVARSVAELAVRTISKK